MRKFFWGILLILMMLGHNYVAYTPQDLQIQLQEIHHISVTIFNLLYTIPSVVAIATIIPVGFIYHCYPNFTLLLGIGLLFVGEVLSAVFGSEGKPNYFILFVFARCLQISGSEVLYMIQGNLASSWMGIWAGVVFILPQIGQILNALVTPQASIHLGVPVALWIGVGFCSISLIACVVLFIYLKKKEKTKYLRSLTLSRAGSAIQNVMVHPINEPVSNHAILHNDLKPNNGQVHTNQLHNENHSIRNSNFGKQQGTQKRQLEMNSMSIFESIKAFFDNILNRCKNPQIISPQTNQINHDAKQSQRVSLQRNTSMHLRQTGEGFVQIQIKQKNAPEENTQEPKQIFKAGKIFWLTIAHCTFCQSLYFPFLGNANALIQFRFKIEYSRTGYFLFLPFAAAILTTFVMLKVLDCCKRKSLIFSFSFVPFAGHLIILLIPNSDQGISLGEQFALGIGFFVLGIGLGAYYSICFPAIGMAVPQSIRDYSYGLFVFFQTIIMAVIPVFSGIIIDSAGEHHEAQGYKNSSIMYASLAWVAIFFALLIKIFGRRSSYKYNDEDEISQTEHSIKDQRQYKSKDEELNKNRV